MKKKIGLFIVLAVALTLCVCACGGNTANTDVGTDISVPSTDTDLGELYIHSIEELNQSAHEKDSHALYYKSSTLEQNFRDYSTYEGMRASDIKGYYPRIKKLDNGMYMLVFHNTKYGGSIYVSFSKDITRFSTPKEIIGPVVLDGEKKLYMTPDAVQMPSGRIIVACSYRSTSAYQSAIGKNGIVIRYTDDYGNTWSEQKTVYVGTNWEPSLLVTGESEVKLFFTSTAQTIEKYGFNNRSGVVGMITSKDNGESWTPNVTSSPWKAQIVAQRYVGTLAGGVIKMTDQMPVAVQLNNGTTALALEEQINDNFTLAFAYSNTAFSDVSLDFAQSGPADTKYSIFKGAGPYIRQFASGETVLTYHWSKTFRYRLGDANARAFADEQILFEDAGHWGSVEIDGSHSCIMTIGKNIDDKLYGIYITRMYLNHMIEAERLTPELDGNGKEWQGDQAWFVGSDSQAQMSVRTAHDSDKAYILVERLDSYLDKSDTTNLFFDDGTAGGFYFIKISPDGKAEAKRYNTQTKRYENADLSSSIEVAVRLSGTLGDNSDKDIGYVMEIAVDKSVMNIQSDGCAKIAVSLSNKDGVNDKFISDTMQGVDVSDKTTWIPVKMG